MKISLRQKAKSALSILLTLCMILSVISVGIVSVGAADKDLAESGWTWTKGYTVYFDNSWTNWSNVYVRIGHGSYCSAYSMTLVSGTEKVYSYTLPSTDNDWENASAFQICNNAGWTGDNNSIFNTYANNSTYKITASTRYMKYNIDADIFIIPVSSGYNGSGTDAGGDKSAQSGCTFYNCNGVNKVSPTKENDNNDAGYSTNTDFKTLNKSVSVTSVDNGSVSVSYTSGSGGTITAGNSANVLYGSTLTVTQTADSGYAAGSYTGTCINGKASDTVSNGTTCYVGYRTTPTTACAITGSFVSTAIAHTKPVISFDHDGTVNSGSNATLTVTNHSAIANQVGPTSGVVDNTLSYKIFKDNVELASSAYTYDNNGHFTVPASNGDGSYTVQAITSDTINFKNSEISTGASLTVYSPKYCLVGNINRGAIEINGSTVTPANNSLSGAGWWQNWQSNLIINNPTDKPGKYSLTFTISDNAERSGDHELGIYHETEGQRAFIYNDTPYNTSNADITVPDSGITEGLFAYTLADTNAGGALKLKKGQTYTITIDQTLSYDGSSPKGKITINARDVFADTYAKKKDFNSTTGVYESVTDGSDTIGTATAVPKHNNGTLTTDLTATVVNSNYDFIGWYSAADCADGTCIYNASECINNGNTYTKNVSIDSTTVYYALFREKMPSNHAVGIYNPPGGTITLTGGVAATGGSATTAYAGATVSMSFDKSDSGKDFTRWKITSTATGSDVSASVLNPNATMASASFTMQDYPVTVTALLSDRTTATITPLTNNPSLGSASVASGTHYVGDTSVGITATPTGGVFVKWQVTGCTVANANSKNTTISVTSPNVTVKAIFDYKTYNLHYNGKKYTMLRQSNGKYVSTITVDKDGGQFTIYNDSDALYAVSDSNPHGLHTNGSAWPTGPVSSWNSNAGYKYSISNGDTGKYYIIFDPAANSGTGSVTIDSTNPMGTVAEIYAKDGSIRYNSDGNSSGALWDDGGDITCKKGVTVISKINGTDVPNPDSKRYPDSAANSDHLKIYSAPMGSTITINTTVNSDYANKGFYVGMFVINGWKVEASNMGSNVYSANFTLTDEYNVDNLSSKKSFEITPVYYNTNFEYITFYVDAASVPTRWGKTISVCATYSNNSGSPADVAHFEGSYPGQPLGREGDLYEIKVAKTYYSYANSKWTKEPLFYPAATITSYNFDNVHHYYYAKADESLGDDGTNYQTYDYADFSYLAQIDRIESILFRCKDTSNDNAKGKTNYNLDYTTTFEPLTDYYGHLIDALGNVLKDGSGNPMTASDVTESQAQVKIVSAGNVNTQSNSTTRTKGKWSTYWTAYDVSNNDNHPAITMVSTPADYINTNIGKSGADPSRNIVFQFANGTSTGKNATNLENKITYISYDEQRDNNLSENNTGKRIDGQWYYSAQSDFDSTVKVAYTSETAGTALTSSNTTIEDDSNSSSNTGYVGATSGTKVTLDGKTTCTYSNVTTEAKLQSTIGSGYVFVGWFIFDGTNYTKIHENYTDHNTTMTMKKNYTVVAVVRQVGTGDLVITHSRYSGKSPAANSGTGKYYVSAVVKDASGNTVTEIPEAQNMITVSSLHEDYKLTIKLRTVCDGADTFYAWYEEALGENYARTGKYYEICSEGKDPMGEKEVSYEMFDADCSTFFSGNSLTRKTIDFYSDIVHVSKYATLTYRYYDRFAQNGAGQMVSYIVDKVELTSDEIDAGYIPSDEKISRYAPNVIDTIYTDTKWQIIGTKVQRTASNITLMATQDVKTCDVQYVSILDATAAKLFTGGTQKSVTEFADWTNETVSFNDYLSYENSADYNEFYVKAPETLVVNDTTYNFVRYDVYRYDRALGATNQLLFSSNDNPYGNRIYEDCVIYPIYEASSSAKVLTASIGNPVLNREVFTENSSLVDKLYIDIILAYLNTNCNGNGEVLDPELTGVIIEDLDKGYTYETGLILDNSVQLSETDYNTLKTAAESGSPDTTNSILANYSSGFATEANVRALAEGTNASGANHLYKYINNNSNLTNKNRLDKVLRLTNKESNQKYVFAAYSYIVIKRGETVVGYAVSAPQKINLCYVANKPLAA